MNIVITGSTRGIGRGLAEAFLERGHSVVVSGREAAATQASASALAAGTSGRCVGVPADVADFGSVQRLWDAAVARMGSVDIWVNNAGLTNRKRALAELSATEITQVVQTNLLGTLNGCRVALAGMRSQGRGRLFNMEGFGSDGLVQPGLTVYGATKHAVRYLTKSLVRENAGSALVIGYLSPGIVVTELLTRDLYGPGAPELESRGRILRLLADRVETVAPFLVDGMLKAEKSGAAIRWMTPWQALGRVLTSPFVKRDPFKA